MARTVRRKHYASTITGYVRKRVLKNEHAYENDSFRLLQVNRGKIEDLPYDEYVEETLRRFHLDKTNSMWRFELYWWTVPREVRQISLKRQTRAHREAIRKGIADNDLDIVLQARDSRELIDWWMYY